MADYYDRRMSLWDNWRYKAWRPFLCWAKGHAWWCARITPTDPQQWFWMCRRCYGCERPCDTACGQCDNGCRDDG